MLYQWITIDDVQDALNEGNPVTIYDLEPVDHETVSLTVIMNRNRTLVDVGIASAAKVLKAAGFKTRRVGGGTSLYVRKVL